MGKADEDSPQQPQQMSDNNDKPRNDDESLTDATLITWIQPIVVTPTKSLNFTTAVGAGKWSGHVIVVDTKPGSVARGRLYRGDIIMAIDDNPITSNDDLQKHARPKVNSGGRLVFLLGRKRQNIRPGFEYKVLIFEVTLDVEFGLSVIQCQDGAGLLVTNLKPGPIARQLKVGDLIREVNEMKVKTKQELTNELAFGMFTLDGALRLGIERAVRNDAKAHIAALIGDDTGNAATKPPNKAPITKKNEGKGPK